MELSCRQSQGGMLAINAELSQVESILKAESLELAIANDNSPSQVVLSGAIPELDKAREVFSACGLHSVPLNVAGAFHSPLMTEARERFAISLDGTEFTRPSSRVYSNVSATRYPLDIAEIRSLLSSQITAPIRFVDMIRNMYREGIHTFVEAGPGKVLQTLIGAILKDQPHSVIALDASCGKGQELDDLGCALAQLAAVGHDIDLRQWDPTPPVVQEPNGFSIQISGANHFEAKKMSAMQHPLISHEAQATVKPGIPSNPPSPPTLHDSARSESNRDLIQTTLLALQKMQQDTSELHRQYLDSQQSAQRSIELLIQQQLRGGGVEPEVRESTAVIMPSMESSPTVTSPEAKHAPPILAPETTSVMPNVSERVHSASAGIARETLLDIVAEKTGYPREVLTPEMSLDKDLGIDSIKRVEIFSALSEHFPALAALSASEAGSLDTLQQIEAHLEGATRENSVPATVSVQLPKAQPDPAASTQENTSMMTAIISVIADKTGYPSEALNPSMRMDEDLGIDSIKRVEIFSTLQERFPYALVVEPDAMARLRSIGDIMGHLGNGSVQPAHEKNGSTVNGNGNGNGNGAAPPFSPEVSEPRRPAPNMSLPVGAGNLDIGLHRLVLKSAAITLEKREPLHIQSDAMIGILAEDEYLSDALQHAFRQRGILSKRIHTDQKPAVGPLAGLLIVSPEQVCLDMLKRAFTVIRNYGPELEQASAHGTAFLTSVSRLNGKFGLGSDAIAQPLSAGLGGIIKTAAREWPQVHCKSIDISEAWENHQKLADAIVSEVLLDGPLEVGLSQQGPIALELTPEAPLPSNSGDGALLCRAELVLVSGGARGISAAIAIALARHYQPTLVLLGRSPEPFAEPDWLQGVIGERAIKQAIHQHHDAAKSPKDIERLYRQSIANREMLETLTTIEASGSKALYRSVDIRNHDETTHTLKELISEHGPLRGIVHGAGILADSLIIDKTEAEFASVLSTKCDGFINLLDCLNGQAPAFIVACSSTTARLGRRGQADYAAANECLNKLTQKAARQYVSSKVLSVNWGPWDGGMVDTRLKAIFKKEGVGLIPLDTGAEYLIQELESGPSRDVELVVLGPTPNRSLIADPPSLQLCYSQEVSLASMPILGSHVINDRAVVPVALIIEWLAHGALHSSPGLRFVGLEDFKVYKGITLDSTQSLKIRVLAGEANCVQTDRGLREIIMVEVRSDDLLHARAMIHLSEDYPTSVDLPLAGTHAFLALQPYTDSSLFHGAELQGLTYVSGCDDQGISGETRTAPEPAVWLKNPLRSQWLADPLVLDASFQLMILWTEHFYSHGSLPTAIGRLDLYAPFPATSVAIDIQLQNRQAHKATARIDFRDNQGCVIARIDEFECVIDISLNAGFSRNTLSSHS